MSTGRLPSVFVSSTCYDLRQVRADMNGFIEAMGYNPVLSEYPSFPTDPDVTAVENCLKVVDEHADIFVLIVGGRYGSTPGGEKSVTNLEYLSARAKGIPIYVFVEKAVLNVLPIWKANPETDFKAVVDSPKLFEFVSSLKDSSGVWIFPFETAQEITNTLRKQLAYLFMDALHLRTRAKNAGLSDSLLQLRGGSLRLAIERPRAWEYRLFGESLEQEIAKHKQIKQDMTYGIALGGSEYYEHGELISWFRKKGAEAQRLLSAATHLLNVALVDAFGPPGTPGDPENIVYVARRVADIYRRAIEWTIEHQHVEVSDELQNLVRLHSKLLSNIIKEIEEYSVMLQREIKEALATLPSAGEPPRVLTFTLTLTAPSMDDFIQEMNRVNVLYGIPLRL